MRKILFLLLLTVASYGQTTTGKETKFPYGIRNQSVQTITTPTYLNTQGTDGTQGVIPSAYIEKTANKTNTISGYSETLYPNEKASHDALDLKLNISDLPTNLTLYPTTTTSDVSGYVVMVKDIHDVRYNSTAVDVSTPTITTTDQLVSQRISDAGILIGQPGVFNITTFGNIRHLSGSGTATFYFKVFHRDSAGVETLICTSSISAPVTDGGYSEFTASGVWDDGDFVASDRIVIKSYANRIAGGSDPVYQFQFGGTSPVRTLLPVPFSVVDAGYELSANKQNSLAIDGTGTKYPTVDAVNAGLPTNYSKIVYVNATSPITATIFDTENPPVTNNNALKNDVANLYIDTDANTWVYETGTGYRTETVTATSSNFYLAGTTTDAGNTKTGHISRTGNISTSGKLASSGATTLSTTSTETTYIGTSTSNPDLAKFVVKGTKSGTGSHYIASFLNDAGVRMGAIDDGGGYTATADITANNINLANGGFVRIPLGGGIISGTKYFYYNNGGVSWLATAPIGYEGSIILGSNSLPPKSYVDAKITQTITNGVTDKSPSEDAVYDAIDGVVKTIISDTPTSTLTGTLTETLMHTYTISGGKLPASCMPNLKVKISKSGTVGTVSLRIKVNTVNDFSTATQIALYTSATATNIATFVRNLTVSSGSMYVNNATISFINDEAASTSGSSTITYDPSVTQYWFVSLQNSDSTDTTRVRSIKLVN